MHLFPISREKVVSKYNIIDCPLTDVCVAFPALSAIEAGYDIVAAIDGSGTINKTVRETAVPRMIQAGATIMTGFPIMAELQGDWKKSTIPDMVRSLQNIAKVWSYCK
ncbi:MAG: isochorismatase family protein [Candidatus Nitrosocosmicus sp.]|nr:isochorismatase family protein [Candidatus Nitrosocosmicus sp.]MDN5868218.1 isochorismatase family protein [Candidatus Nitrosocosmicus sp.]